MLQKSASPLTRLANAIRPLPAKSGERLEAPALYLPGILSSTPLT